MSNAIEGVDTLEFHTFNSFKPRFGGAQILRRKRLVTDPARTSAGATQELMRRVTQATGIRYGTVRYGAVRCGTVRYGAVRCGTVRYGTVRYGTVPF
jgi:hypothetical protein